MAAQRLLTHNSKLKTHNSNSAQTRHLFLARAAATVRPARQGGCHRGHSAGYQHHCDGPGGGDSARFPGGFAGRMHRPGPAARLPDGRRARRPARRRLRFGQLPVWISHAGPSAPGPRPGHQHHQRHHGPAPLAGGRGRGGGRVSEPGRRSRLCPAAAARRAGGVRRLEGPVLPRRHRVWRGAGRATGARFRRAQRRCHPGRAAPVAAGQGRFAGLPAAIGPRPAAQLARSQSGFRLLHAA